MNQNDLVDDLINCRKCQDSLPLSLFRKDNRQRSGYQPVCKQCDRAEAKARMRKAAALEREKVAEKLNELLESQISGKGKLIQKKVPKKDQWIDCVCGRKVRGSQFKKHQKTMVHRARTEVLEPIDVKEIPLNQDIETKYEDEAKIHTLREE